ncbi:hypothetical protein EAE96_004328 [Botrytis aclada]|nr:hypothetical protein EAE96_004328 [Botrytis aclada]
MYWVPTELEFLESLYKNPSTRNLSRPKLYNLFLTEQARHLSGGDLHSSDFWPQRSLKLSHFWVKFREAWARVDRANASLQRRHMQVQVPVQAPRIQQVPVQAPQTQQMPVQVIQEQQQGSILAPMQVHIQQASTLSLPLGNTRFRADTVRIPGRNTCFPHHIFLLPDQRILLPNGVIMARISTDPPHSIQRPDPQARRRVAALPLAPRRTPNPHLPLPGIRRVVGRELQGRAHLNATATARASAVQAPQYQQRQRSAAPKPSASLGTPAIAHRAAVQIPQPQQRKRSAAPSPSPELSTPGSREHPIILTCDEDSPPTPTLTTDKVSNSTSDSDSASSSDSRDQTPVFARAFQGLTVAVLEKENSSSATPVVRLANERRLLPDSPIVSAGPMALERILNW